MSFRNPKMMTLEPHSAYDDLIFSKKEKWKEKKRNELICLEVYYFFSLCPSFVFLKEILRRILVRCKVVHCRTRLFFEISVQLKK